MKDKKITFIAKAKINPVILLQTILLNFQIFFTIVFFYKIRIQKNLI